jgi:hypothetical protein
MLRRKALTRFDSIGGVVPVILDTFALTPFAPDSRVIGLGRAHCGTCDAKPGDAYGAPGKGEPQRALIERFGSHEIGVSLAVLFPGFKRLKNSYRRRLCFYTLRSGNIRHDQIVTNHKEGHRNYRIAWRINDDVTSWYI